MGGRLHVDGITVGKPWDSARLDWWQEDELDPILAGGNYGVKVRTREELEVALVTPAGIAPTRRVWIHESLEGDTRHLWNAR
jgi:hypothetical protein